MDTLYNYDFYNINGSTHYTTLSKQISKDSIVLDDAPQFSMIINEGYSELSLRLGFGIDNFPFYIDYMNMVEVSIINDNNVRGEMIYRGWISDIEIPLLGAGSNITLQPINKFLSRSDFRNGVTINGVSAWVVNYNAVDPSNIIKDVIDDFRTRNASTYGPYLAYGSSTIHTVGATNISPIFERAKHSKVITETLEQISVPDWYFWIDSDGEATLKEKPDTATHTVNRLTDVVDGRIRGTVGNIINQSVLFSSGLTASSGYALYGVTSSQLSYGLVEKTEKDDRYSVEVHAQARVTHDVANDEAPDEGLNYLIINRNYAIETIKPLDTLNIKNIPNNLSLISDNMLVTQVEYSRDSVKVYLERLNLNLEKTILQILDKNRKQ